MSLSIFTNQNCKVRKVFLLYKLVKQIYFLYDINKKVISKKITMLQQLNTKRINKLNSKIPYLLFVILFNIIY